MSLADTPAAHRKVEAGTPPTDRAAIARTPGISRLNPDPMGPATSAATFLATEHLNLSSTRSTASSEALSRTTIFLTVLSAAVVALALIADATDFGRLFSTFALCLLPAVLFLGVATYLRLVQIHAGDVSLVVAMNRIRRAYLDLAPELAPYFTAGANDDESGVLKTYGLISCGRVSPSNFFIATPTILATIDAAIAASITTVVALDRGVTGTALTIAGVSTGVVVWIALFAVQIRSLIVLRRTHVPRFPHSARV